jgi:hypothetical protein
VDVKEEKGEEDGEPGARVARDDARADTGCLPGQGLRPSTPLPLPPQCDTHTRPHPLTCPDGRLEGRSSCPFLFRSKNWVLRARAVHEQPLISKQQQHLSLGKATRKSRLRSCRASCITMFRCSAGQRQRPVCSQSRRGTESQ